MATDGTAFRIGFDIGGTFTDFVLADAGTQKIHLHKCLTTPEDPSVGALEGMNELLGRVGLSMADIGQVVHGTTLVTNAIIERKGCKLGFLTTRGFRDVLEMGTEQRYDIHDLFLQYPDPLAPRHLRREIDERIDRDGVVVKSVDRDQALAEIRALIADGVEAIAVCLLHSYKTADHERAVRELIREVAPDMAVSLSCDIHPELREYERSSTTAANAYVQPLMGVYVDRLQTALSAGGFKGRFHLMQSSGGLTTPQTAIDFPIRFLESGPAGGARATAYIGEIIGSEDIISFDMGGTTAKACLIQAGAPDISSMIEAGRVHRFKRGSGLPIHAPVIDMIEVGAGGGSIARVDELGLLKVGPDSAGATPGPACYGQGGEQPTVTDANLLLGYLDPTFFLGGRMSLDSAASERAMESVAKALDVSVMEAAWGIIDLVAENMAGAARVHIVEKGRDPRRYAMVAMGGAGPLHAARVARKLGVGEVVVPPASGAASAMGMLASPIGFEMSRSLPMPLEDADLAEISQVLADMEQVCRDRVQAAGGDGDLTVERFAEMRLQGQMHEITVLMPKGDLSAGAMKALAADFASSYARLYTHLYDGARIEIINYRVRCTAPTPSLSMLLDTADAGTKPLKGTRVIYDAEAGGMVEANVYDRYALTPGTKISGPAVIEEREATTIVPGDAELLVDEVLNLRVSLSRETASEVIVASDMALDQAIARIGGDSIGLEIMWSRMINIAEECWHTVIRTAFSLIIGEAQDFACELLDAKGKQIVHSPRAMPVFNLTLPIAVNAMIERFPAQMLVDGDVLITNDPWLCAGHLFDIAIAVPVFREDRIVAFVGIVGHVGDIGGTKDSLNAREIYEEGIQIPPMKLFKAGKPNDDLFDILGENVRRPDQVLGDIHAMVAAGVTGSERIKEFMEEYGMHDLEALATVVQDRAEGAMRKAVSALPDGVYEHVVQADGIDQIMTYPIQVTVEGDEINVNFEGAPPQTQRGGSNCTLSYTQAHATYPLKCILTPEIPGNSGCYQPMSVAAPLGSIMNCEKPMAVNTRVRTGWYVAPNIFGALAEAAPENVQSFTGLPSSALFYGTGPDGLTYSDHLFQGGGQGGSYHGDGQSALLYPTSAANTSVELFETRVPVLVVEKALVPDSGGPGRNRGGLSQDLVTRKLHNDGLPCQVGLYPNGVNVSIAGLFGGVAGWRGGAWVDQADGEKARDMGVGGLSQLESVDQMASVRLAGGSGFGDPFDREYDAVQRDLDAGFITPEGARRDYGCAVTDGAVDRAASDSLRAVAADD